MLIDQAAMLKIYVQLIRVPGFNNVESMYMTFLHTHHIYRQ